MALGNARLGRAAKMCLSGSDAEMLQCLALHTIARAGAQANEAETEAAGMGG